MYPSDANAALGDPTLSERGRVDAEKTKMDLQRARAAKLEPNNVELYRNSPKNELSALEVEPVEPDL